MSTEALGPTHQPEIEPQFSEVSYTLPEFIDFARDSGDEATATEFEGYLRRHGDRAMVKLIIPNNSEQPPAIELIFTEN